jgi:UDPglucose--hexose-1-phosphate uridylyltransferase
MSEVWEQRWHPLRREWVIITSHRGSRPWSGGELEELNKPVDEFIDDCYLCPGNKRVSGMSNPQYEQIFVFDNDHPSIGNEAPAQLAVPAGIYQNKQASGVARVVCYDPRHNVSLAELTEQQCLELLVALGKECDELSKAPSVNSIFLFENKGEVTGVSNPHPHCQIYGTNFIFPAIRMELDAVTDHRAETGRSLFADIINAEKEDGRRIIAENDSAIAFIPYFARYPYETYVLCKSDATTLAELDVAQLKELSEVLGEVLVRFDNLWNTSFPYIMVFHQAPCDGGSYEDYRFHIQFHPPLRQPGLQKYLAGAESGGGCFLNDVSPEQAAADLSAVSNQHYKTAGTIQEL